jgi:hypothetical protein
MSDKPERAVLTSLRPPSVPMGPQEAWWATPKAPAARAARAPGSLKTFGCRQAPRPRWPRVQKVQLPHYLGRRQSKGPAKLSVENYGHWILLVNAVSGCRNAVRA